MAVLFALPAALQLTEMRSPSAKLTECVVSGPEVSVPVIVQVTAVSAPLLRNVNVQEVVPPGATVSRTWKLDTLPATVMTCWALASTRSAASKKREVKYVLFLLIEEVLPPPMGATRQVRRAEERHLMCMAS
jgi:hypothetical protein